MPPNTVYVGRPTRWGNPFPVDIYHEEAIDKYRRWLLGEMSASEMQESSYYGDPRIGLAHMRRLVKPHELRGKDLACWCKEDAPCHADVLLELLKE